MTANAERSLISRLSPRTLLASNITSLLRLGLSALLSLLVAGCALPNKFTGLVQPPSDKALVYLYTSNVDKSYNLDNTTVTYSLNDMEKRRLPSGASHAQAVPAGKLTIYNYTKTKTRSLPIRIEKNETVFIYFKPIVESKSGSSVKFGHAISISRNTEKLKNQAVALLAKTRVYYFDADGQELPYQDAIANKAPVNLPNASFNKPSATNPAPAKTPAVVSAPILKEPPTSTIAAPTVATASNTLAATDIKATQNNKPLLDKQVLDNNEVDAKAKEPVELTPNQTLEIVAINQQDNKAAVSNAKAWSDLNAAAETNKILRFNVSCKKPYKLTQGCSALSRTNTVFKIDGHKLKMAASADGKIIYIEPAQTFGNAAKQIFTLSIAKDQQKTALSEGIKAVKQLLAVKNISILKTYAVTERKRNAGWILLTDADSYQLLKDSDT